MNDCEIIVGGTEHQIKIWDVNSKAVTAQFSTNYKSVADLDSEANLILSALEDGVV